MGKWAYLLGGLLVWAAHFFAVYIAASLFPGTQLAKWLVLALTIAALVALWLFSRLMLRASPADRGEDGDHWGTGLVRLGCGLAAVAIVYQGLPALLV